MLELLQIELNEKPFAVNYKENVANAYKMFAEIEMDLENENEEELAEELKRVDLMQEDVLHIIELMSFNAVEGYKFAKMLQIIRKARRKIKDRFEERREIRELIKIYKSSGFKQQLNNGVAKVESLPKRREKRSYRLRELQELEGFSRVIQEQKKKMNLV